jgi:O-antigen/teichoic acid export membrane protein
MRFLRRAEQFSQSDIGQKLVGPGLLALIIKISGAALSYIMYVAFAHMLSPSDYGYFGLSFNLAILLATVCSFGLPTAIMRFWPEYLAQDKSGLARGIVQQSLRTIGLGSLGLAAIAALFSWMGYGSSFLGFSDAPIAIATLAAASAFSDFAAGLLRAQGNVIWAMLPRDVVWRILTPVLALILTLYGIALDNRTAVYICGLVLLVLVFLQVRKLNFTVQSQTQSVRTQHDWPVWRKTIAPLWASSILYAMIQQLDVVIVGSLASPAEAGSYFAAQKTASLLGLVMLAGGLVGAPLMSANYHTGKLKELQRLCSILSIAIAITTLIGVIVLIVFGHELLGFFDPSFASAYGVLMILAFGFAVDSLAGPNAYLMQMTSLESAYLKIMACCYAGVLVAQLVLVPKYGGLGAAAASACGIIVWNLCAITLLRKQKGLDPSVLGLVFKTRHG